jgi:phosphoglycolate phosphatase-like HAD superfamily hydrolase
MNRYILDFDYTLFDTNAMRVVFQAELQKHCGVTIEQYQDAEKTITADGALYSLDAHIIALFPENDEREKGRAVAESMITRMGEWIYPDVVPTLKVLKKQQHHITLLSFGSRDWQSLKISHSGITEFFDSIEIVEGPKTEPVHLFEQKSDEKIIFVNDRAREIDELHGVFPHVEYVWIAREHTPYSQTPPTAPCQQISSFSEIIGRL